LRERIELPHAARLVPFDRLGACPRGRLLTPDSGYPCLRAGQRALERVDLAGTAQFEALHGVPFGGVASTTSTRRP
jgi:hypothetical protein